jgi:murein DD-endopeptidase MepM/ murein hydrolase activator NlpD
VGLKKVTIVVLPEGTHRTRQFRLPRILLVSLVLAVLSSGAILTWVVRDYSNLRAQLPRLTRLQKENEQQRRQFLHLAERIDRMTQRMGELNAFDSKLRVMVNLETGDDNGRYQGIGGADSTVLLAAQAPESSPKGLVRMMHRALDALDTDIAVGMQGKGELNKFLENQKTLLASTPSIWPTKGWLSSRFGHRISPFTGQREFHRGIDVSVRMNAPIVAPADGVVSSVTWDHGYGKLMAVSHGYGLVTRYAHLAKVLVKKGQYVKRGETIALVGNSGRSTGPHLHYEVHLNGVAVDPLNYILN